MKISVGFFDVKDNRTKRKDVCASCFFEGVL